MVSQADSLRTSALPAIIFLVEYASVRVTAKGKPSGIATTTIVTATVTILITPFDSITLTRMATPKWRVPICIVCISREVSAQKDG